MGFFDFLKIDEDYEERSMTEHSYANFAITSYFGNDSKVTEAQALRIPAVASAVELITASVAQLPIYLYKKNEKGEVIKLSEDHRSFLLNKEPNETMNGNTLKRLIVKDYIFHGASYLKIERERNKVIGLYSLPIKEVSIEKYRENSYKFNARIRMGYDNNSDFFNMDEVVTILKDSEDGFTATGVLIDNADTLSLAIDEQDYTMSILKNGALPVGVLKSSSRLTEKTIERLRNTWENLYGGAKKAGKTVILEEGLDYLPLSMKPNELDLTNIRKHTVSELARIFNVPESMINSTANKYASNEQNNIYFLQYCLAPIITSIESSYNKSLLLEEEKKNGYFFKFDVSELLRTTETEKISTISRAVDSGLLSVNEGRSRIDMPSMDNDFFTWSIGKLFYDPITNKFTIPNTGKTIDPNNNESFEDSLSEFSDTKKLDSEEEVESTNENGT